MPRVLAGRPSPAGARDRARRRVAVYVAVALVVALALGGLAALARGPRFVDRVSIENPTPYLVDVAVANGSHDGWTLLAPVQPGERVDVRDVVDAGDTWVFRFSSGPTEGGEVTVSRGQLAARGWTITVPAPVAARLSRTGAATFAG